MIISPSILNCNFLNLEKEIKSIKKSDYIHLDIMDGHFVPNISFGPSISDQISKAFPEKKLDIHLMLQNPINYIENFYFKNTRFITIHAEANNVEECINKIKKLNIKVGLSLKPNSPISLIEKYLDMIDLVLIMSVEPGFGGQEFIPETYEKIHIIKSIKNKFKHDFLIEVDGGININNIQNVANAGADMCVIGSFLFRQQYRSKTLDLLKKIK